MDRRQSNTKGAGSPGKWESIPSLRLPDEFLRLDSRLDQLDQNAIVRLYLFRSRRKPVSPKAVLASKTWSVSGNIVLAILKVIGLAFMADGCLAVILFAFLATVSARFLRVELWLAIAGACILLMIGLALFRRSLDYFDCLRKHLLELRCLPLTAEDFAIAHWGSNMLLNATDRQFPAIALWRCCREMEGRLSSCTGWTYYPSTFGVAFSDRVERSEVLLIDENGNPAIKDQFNLDAETFTYSGRLDYLAALWREYLEVWWPDQPWEGETRRATLPTRAQRATQAGRPI